MYKYVPKRLKRSVIWSFIGVFFGALMFGMSYFINTYKSIAQLIAFVFFVFGIYIACRYSLISYYYILDGENFRIFKVNGKKQTEVGNLSLRTGKYLKRTAEMKKRPPVRVKYNFSRNFAPADEYVYAFDWNGAAAEIIFEPNEEFAKMMAEKIEELKNSEETQENIPTNGWYDE